MSCCVWHGFFSPIGFLSPNRVFFFPMWGFFPEKVCCWHLALNKVVVLCFVYILVCVHVCLCCVVHNGR